MAVLRGATLAALSAGSSRSVQGGVGLDAFADAKARSRQFDTSGTALHCGDRLKNLFSSEKRLEHLRRSCSREPRALLPETAQRT